MRLPGVYSTKRTHHLPLPDPLGVRKLSPWKNRTIDHVVCVSNAVTSGNHILRAQTPTRGASADKTLTGHVT
jgi:hypothetical protein